MIRKCNIRETKHGAIFKFLEETKLDTNEWYLLKKYFIKTHEIKWDNKKKIQRVTCVDLSNGIPYHFYDELEIEIINDDYNKGEIFK